jgi:hypothetical protein
MLPLYLTKAPCLGHHIVLNYVDSNGDHYTLQGVPENKFDHDLHTLMAFSDANVPRMLSSTKSR